MAAGNLDILKDLIKSGRVTTWDLVDADGHTAEDLARGDSVMLALLKNARTQEQQIANNRS